jgi:hypothetical protein
VFGFVNRMLIGYLQAVAELVIAYRHIGTATLNFFRESLPGSAFISNFALANLS